MSSSSAHCPPRRARLRSRAEPPCRFTDTFTSRYIDTGEFRQHAVIGGEGPRC